MEQANPAFRPDDEGGDPAAELRAWLLEQIRFLPSPRPWARPRPTRSSREISLHRPKEPRPFSLEPVVELARRELRFLNGKAGRRWGQGPIAATAIRLGINRQMVHRWLHEGLGVYQADEIAIMLGLHPSCIWPEWFSMTELADTEALEVAA